MTIIGPTGAGKTTLALALAPIRDYSIIVATKPRDATLRRWARDSGYEIIRDWPPRLGQSKVILWPRIDRPQDVGRQGAEIARALEGIYTAGGWSVVIDEVRYVGETLRCWDLLQLLWLQGRSLGVSVVACTQRPRWIPLEAYDQASHLFLFRDPDPQNSYRMIEMTGIASAELRECLASLGRHDMLYVDLRRGEACISRVDRG